MSPESGAPARWLAWARLVRAPNCCTAVADVLAGAAVAETGRWAWGALALAASASALLYGAGCVLNDWVDLPKDRLDKPRRPLPAGQIGPTTALVAAMGLMTAALGLGTLAGPATGLVVVALALTVAAYDLGAKRFPLPAVACMATARAGNVALGAVAVAGGWPGGIGWLLAPALMGVYVAGLTGMSLFEDRAVGRPLALGVGLAAPAVVVGVAAGARVPWLASLPAAVCVATLVWALMRVWRTPAAPQFGAYVRAAVLGIALLDATFALGVGAWPTALVILGLAVVARLLARRIAV